MAKASAKRVTKALDAWQAARSDADRLNAARRVREGADELERAAVDAARAGGLTWAEIGAIYGLTKQGAQQRFRT